MKTEAELGCAAKTFLRPLEYSCPFCNQLCNFRECVSRPGGHRVRQCPVHQLLVRFAADESDDLLVCFRRREDEMDVRIDEAG